MLFQVCGPAVPQDADCQRERLANGEKVCATMLFGDLFPLIQ